MSLEKDRGVLKKETFFKLPRVGMEPQANVIVTQLHSNMVKFSNNKTYWARVFALDAVVWCQSSAIGEIFRTG